MLPTQRPSGQMAHAAAEGGVAGVVAHLLTQLEAARPLQLNEGVAAADRHLQDRSLLPGRTQCSSRDVWVRRSRRSAHRNVYDSVRWPRASESKRADRAHSAREILVVVMLSTQVGEVYVMGHVRCRLGGRPVAEIVRHAACSEIACFEVRI